MSDSTIVLLDRGASAPGRSKIVRDPGVTIGRFRILQRTDGLYIVYDPGAPTAKGTVTGSAFERIGEATTYAEHLAGRHPGDFAGEERSQ